MLQATVRLHSCCMMTCTLNGGPEGQGDMEAQRRIPGRTGHRHGYPGKLSQTTLRISETMCHLYWMFLVRWIHLLSRQSPWCDKYAIIFCLLIFCLFSSIFFSIDLQPATVLLSPSPVGDCLGLECEYVVSVAIAGMQGMKVNATSCSCCHSNHSSPLQTFPKCCCDSGPEVWTMGSLACPTMFATMIYAHHYL